MGVDVSNAKSLLVSHRSGVIFRRMATIGRQWLLAGPAELKEIFRQLNYYPTGWEKLVESKQVWADEFFRLLGAEEIVSVDFSSYEGATMVHDMNQPIPDHLKGSFDLVFDGGTLEHVFNFPQAIRNCMEMTRIGGHLICCNPANNLLGHGFYQFSPELFFRLLSTQNGYRVLRLILIESLSRRWYEVKDPEILGSRVELLKTAPSTTMFVLAERFQDVPILKSNPQQSDYVQAWQGNPSMPQSNNRSTWMRALIKRVEYIFPSLIREIRLRRMDLKYHSRFFTRVKD